MKSIYMCKYNLQKVPDKYYQSTDIKEALVPAFSERSQMTKTPSGRRNPSTNLCAIRFSPRFTCSSSFKYLQIKRSRCRPSNRRPIHASSEYNVARSTNRNQNHRNICVKCRKYRIYVN